MIPHVVPGAAGFVLAGGRSSRMGRDKALLPAGEKTLVEQIAGYVREAAGSATLIGPPDRYQSLGFPVIADAVEGAGPLGGIYTALLETQAEWNLIVACDMPNLTPEFLRILLREAKEAGKDCLVPSTTAGLEPLCAVYRRTVLAAAGRAIHQNLLKMRDFVLTLDTCVWPVADSGALRNINTPQEWAAR